MQAKRINKWLNSSELKSSLKEQNILDWLNEEGSITASISSVFKFKLEFFKKSQKILYHSNFQNTTNDLRFEYRFLSQLQPG